MNMHHLVELSRQAARDKGLCLCPACLQACPDRRRILVQLRHALATDLDRGAQ
jgi:hypothetical protein